MSKATEQPTTRKSKTMTKTMTRDGMTFTDFRPALSMYWRGREDKWELVGTITLSDDEIRTEHHQFACDITDHTIPAGTYPVIRYYSPSACGYQIGVPMLAGKSVFRSNRERLVRHTPEIYWPNYYVYQLAEMAKRGEIELAPGWTVNSKTEPSPYSDSGFHTFRWFERDGERVSFKGV
jgi:hypothetical protein